MYLESLTKFKRLGSKNIRTKFKKEIEPHEIFLDQIAIKREEGVNVSKKKIEIPLSEKVLKVFTFFCLFLIGILFVKTFYLQTIRGEELNVLALQNKTRIYPLRAKRGVIYDRNLNQLVWNKPRFDLIIDKRELPLENKERERILKEISEIIRIDFNELEKSIQGGDAIKVLIYEGLEYEILISLKAKLKYFPGFQLEKNIIRDYKYGPIFSHLIGYIREIDEEDLKIFKNHLATDYIGKTGLERFYEKELKGTPGQLRVIRDALGRKQSEEVLFLPNPGKDLKLWVDFELQKKLKTSLRKGLDSVGASKGTAIALDPRTGGVLALVNIPSFDNNLLSRGIEPEILQEILENPLKPFFNRAISGEYLIGSVIKPLIALAALEENIICPDKAIHCPRALYFRDRYHPDIIYRHADWRYHGWTDMREAIAMSSNVYFYKIGGGYRDYKGLGVEKIVNYLKLFNWGQRTNIDLPAEAQGFIPDSNWREARKRDWHLGDTYNLSIGQGYLLVTPIQIASIFGAVANKGTLYQPQVVKAFINNVSGLVEKIKPTVVQQNFVNPQNLQVIREGMRKTVTCGTATILNNLSVKAAAKTGTAETAREGFFHNWIVAFAPYDEPEIVLVIAIEDIEGFHSPTNLAAKEILNWYFTR